MNYIDMSDERYSLLMRDESVKLTKKEVEDGWHWCYEMDGLLVNVKDPAFEFLKDCCKCIEFGKIMEETKEKITNIQCGGWSGPCESMNASKVRMNTAYVNEDRNWIVLCPECCEECSEYWSDMWADYNSGRL